MQEKDDSGNWWTLGKFPENWYDCTTWDDYYTAKPTYDYVGVFTTVDNPETETKIFLTQKSNNADNDDTVLNNMNSNL